MSNQLSQKISIYDAETVMHVYRYVDIYADGAYVKQN